ncbi:hypothetical protein MKW98_001026 [Papaver atlanticum]|uniref:Carbamoyl-phosphate synthase small subunit N-terminal domain-containing protein n=1 Tax=Papaver atlanticum TaxID=357466 RepID=A0AAD4TJB8_9MAGN|nr:hypothetical protein MKW98_001026 [Papaver atlanticum]
MATRAAATSLLSNSPFLSSSSRRTTSRNESTVKCFTIVRCSASLSTSNGSIDTPLAVKDRPWKIADARLVLEDGSVWNAKSFGATGTQVGEVVFNTSLTG